MKTTAQLHSNSRQSGFTLIELMMVIVILAIALAIGAPAFKEMTRRSAMSETTNTLIGTLRYARAQAVRTGKTWVVGFSTSDTTPSDAVLLKAFGKGVAKAPENFIVAYSNSDYTGALAFDAATDGTPLPDGSGNGAEKVESLVRTGTYITSSVASLGRIAFYPDGTAHDNTGVLDGGANVTLGICDDRTNETGRSLTLLRSGVIALTDKDDC